MDTITHTLIGLLVSRMGRYNKLPLVVLVAVLCASLPDWDVFLSPFIQDASNIFRHRGITHSILGVLVQVGVISLLVHKVSSWYARRKHSPAGVRHGSLARWAEMLLLLVSLHVFMDGWTTLGVPLLSPSQPLTMFSSYTMGIIDIPLWLIIGSLAIAAFISKKRKAFYGGLGIAFIALYTILIHVYVSMWVKPSVSEHFNVNEDVVHVSPVIFDPILRYFVLRDQDKLKTGFYDPIRGIGSVAVIDQSWVKSIHVKQMLDDNEIIGHFLENVGPWLEWRYKDGIMLGLDRRRISVDLDDSIVYMPPRSAVYAVFDEYGKILKGSGAYFSEARTWKSRVEVISRFLEKVRRQVRGMPLFRAFLD